MKYKVIQKFLTKKKVYLPGDIYENPAPGKFTKALLKHGFIEKIPPDNDFEAWERRGIYSKLTGLIVAPEDYREGDKKFFTFDEARAIPQQLDNGWRLPTRSELVCLCEEFSCDRDGELCTELIMTKLHFRYHSIDSASSSYSSHAYRAGGWWSGQKPRASVAWILVLRSIDEAPSILRVHEACHNAVRLVKETR